MRIILASSSPYRQQIFNRLGCVHEVQNPEFEEKEDSSKKPIDQIKSFAFGKANSVFKNQKKEEDVIVFGFDSVMLHDNKIIGKQKTKKQAFETLQSYRGQKVHFVTSFALMGAWKKKSFQRVETETTSIKFRSDITNCQIRSYLDYGDWKGKGGGFSICGPAIFLMEDIEGDYHNVIGVPLRSIGKAIEDITGKGIFTILTPQKEQKEKDIIL